MSDESLGVIRSESESHEIQYLKRSKTSPQTPYSNFTINIEDLPDPLLFEILLRLPAKSAARYKCVSKRWFALISHHTFFSRFLCLQRDKRNPLPLEPTLILLDSDKGFLATSELPVFETGSFSLDFLPCYQTARTKKLVEFDSPVVVASCNDLVLCCALMLQRDYYICNPYTKQWTAIPPAPQCCYEIRVGFTCEPYYYYKEDVDHQSEKDSNSTVQLNVDYKYAIVRIHSPLFGSSLNSSELNVEIFSSETGVAYKGKLYWVHQLGHIFMIGLDPFSNNSHFDVVDLPDNEWGAVSVSQEGRLRLYRTLLDKDRENEPFRNYLSIWELKDDDDKVGGRVGKWCKIDTLPLDQMVSENPLITEWSRKNVPAIGIAFDPSNDDILNVLSNVDDEIVIIMCNIRENTLKEVTTVNGMLESVFRFMVPWWPTPVHKIEYNHKDTHAAHLNSCLLCSESNQHQILNELKLRFLSMHYVNPYDIPNF
ncbi:hypothetical protein ACLB2K_060753 [Fragaria x ananassa]